MMPAHNRVTLIGNIVTKPELRFTPSGSPVCDMRIAVNEKTKDGKESTQFVDVTAWGKTAEHCEQYLDKGSPIFVDGKLAVVEWDDRETGKKRKKMYVNVMSVQFLGQRPESAQKRERPPRENTEAPRVPDDGNDVPF